MSEAPQGTTPKKSLVAKLAEACDAVGGIEKKGKNEKQNYKYLKAADVAKAIRHEFFSRSIVMTFDEKEFTQIRAIKTNSGGEMGEFLLKCEITFHDGESTEKLGPFGAFGVAMDTGDKAIWKAKTGALKYVLRGIGLIPDEKDDPEGDKEVDAETLPPPRIDPKLMRKAVGQELISKDQAKAFREAAKKNHPIEAVVRKLEEVNGYRNSDDIQKQHYQQLLSWALTKPEPRYEKEEEPNSDELFTRCAKHGDFPERLGSCPQCDADA